MREELSGNFSELALALFRDPMAFDIDVINVFVQEEISVPSSSAPPQPFQNNKWLTSSFCLTIQEDAFKR